MAQFGITKYTKHHYPNTYRDIAEKSRNPHSQYYGVTYVSGRKVVSFGHVFNTLAAAKATIRKYAKDKLHTSVIKIKMI